MSCRVTAFKNVSFVQNMVKKSAVITEVENVITRRLDVSMRWL